MTEGVLWLALGLLLVSSWLILFWVIRRGKLRVRAPSGGVITRTENPLAFWLVITAMALGSHLAVAVLGLLAYFVLLPSLGEAP